MAKTPHFNATITSALHEAIKTLAERTRRSQSKTVVYLVEIGLSLDCVPAEWAVDEHGKQVPTDIPAGAPTRGTSKRALFLAPERLQVQIDNFRADNNFNSFSEALRVLLTAGLQQLDRHGCEYCQGGKPK